MAPHDVIQIHPEVADARRDGAPVVALESAVITAGLPRSPIDPDILQTVRDAGVHPTFDEWDPDGPINLELARAMERTVRAHGAVPATIAVFEGHLRLGLQSDELERLALNRSATKTSIADLAGCVTRRLDAGTTVAATLAACRLTNERGDGNHAIRTFATGGIGGVHRGWTSLPDISADLRALAETPVAVVCAGAKSILDLPATLEWLASMSVPVLGYHTDRFPRFYCTGDPNAEPIPMFESLDAIRDLSRCHWDELGQTTAILLTQDPPAELALDATMVDDVIERAEASALKSGATGGRRTPYLLDAVSRATEGRSLAANLGLLVKNADTAASLAAAGSPSSRP